MFTIYLFAERVLVG